jgi:hypothetical protein
MPREQRIVNNSDESTSGNGRQSAKENLNKEKRTIRNESFVGVYEKTTNVRRRGVKYRSWK